MTWWNRTRLVGLREQLIAELHRIVLPFWAVVEADLARLARSWMLRLWVTATAVIALVLLLIQRPAPSSRSLEISGLVIRAWHSLRQVPPQDGNVLVLCTLLGSYVLLWPGLVVVLSAGAISGELGVVADSVLSRGVGRWQYLLGKWASRVAAVLGAYAVVMVPAMLIGALGGGSPAGSEPGGLVPAGLDAGWTEAATGPAATGQQPSFIGTALAMAAVAAVLVTVASVAVAASALSRSTVLVVAVVWLATYAVGLGLWLVGAPHLSPARLLARLPALVTGQYALAEVTKMLAAYGSVSLAAVLTAGLGFRRRDL